MNVVIEARPELTDVWNTVLLDYLCEPTLIVRTRMHMVLYELLFKQTALKYKKIRDWRHFMLRSSYPFPYEQVRRQWELYALVESISRSTEAVYEPMHTHVEMY